jgi:hypothetical protein
LKKADEFRGDKELHEELVNTYVLANTFWINNVVEVKDDL